MKTVAIIGCGKATEGKEGWAIGHAHARGWLESDVEVKLYGVDVSPENLKAFGETFNLPQEQLFSSTDELYVAMTPDVVSICTWPKLHAPMSIEASNKGVAGIALEKPVALNVSEMNEVKAICEEKGTKLVVAHQRCYDPACQEVKRLIGEGQLGEKVTVEARVSGGWDILSWTTHWFNLVEHLLGNTATKVLAGMDCQQERRYQHAVESASTIFVEYEGGAQATFITGPDSPVLDCGLQISGEKGWIRFSGSGDRYTIADADGLREVVVEVERAKDSFSRLVEDLVYAVDESSTPKVLNVDFGFRATELAYAAQESVRMRKTVSLPLETPFTPLEVLDHQKPKHTINEGKILLIADEHFGSGGREGICEAIVESYGREVEVVDPEEDFSHHVNEAGLVLVYHTKEELNDKSKQALEVYVDAGRALLVLHAGLGAWRNWDTFASWTGRSWVWQGENASWHPHHAIEMTSLPDSILPITWESASLPKDECFVNLQDNEPCIDLLETIIPEGKFPVAWLNQNKPHVGAWMPGHLKSTWSVESQRDGLRAMIRLVSKASR